MIVALARRRVAAVRLDRDDELAKPHEAKPERPVDDVAVIGGVTPHGEQGLPEVRRGRSQLGLVFGQRQRRLERPFGESRDE